MNVLTYLNTMRPALPYSAEKPCTIVSNAELRRWIQNGSVLINQEKAAWDEEIDFPILSLVFFPKSEKRKTTVVWRY